MEGEQRRIDLDTTEKVSSKKESLPVKSALIKFDFPLRTIIGAYAGNEKQDKELWLYEKQDEERPNIFLLGEEEWEVMTLDEDTGNVALRNPIDRNKLIAATMERLPDNFAKNTFLIRGVQHINLDNP